MTSGQMLAHLGALFFMLLVGFALGHIMGRRWALEIVRDRILHSSIPAAAPVSAIVGYMLGIVDAELAGGTPVDSELVAALRGYDFKSVPGIHQVKGRS